MGLKRILLEYKEVDKFCFGLQDQKTIQRDEWEFLLWL